MSTFVLNVPPNRNFGDPIAVQDLRGIQYEIFVDVPPQTKILVYSTLYTRDVTSYGPDGAATPPSKKLGPSKNVAVYSYS